MLTPQSNPLPRTSSFPGFRKSSEAGSPLALELMEGRLLLSAATFAAAASYPTNDWPAVIASGDFNSDGKPDLVTANETGGVLTAGSISLLLGNSDGSFQPRTDIATDIDSVGLTVGDFNHDGNADIAVANQISNNVNIFLGNGNGTFQAKRTLSTMQGPTCLGVGDFNGDGVDDLAVGSTEGDLVNIYLSNGSGAFSKKASLAVIGPASIAVADFGNGQTDLAVASQTNGGAVAALVGNGDGTFQPRQEYAAGDTPIGVAVGDFDGDGHPDLAVTSYNESTVGIFTGKGDGTFHDRTAYTTGLDPHGLAVADFNLDRSADLAVVAWGDDAVSVMPGNGHGAFAQTSEPSVGSEPRSVVVGDFNGDGRIDMAVSNYGDSTVSVLLNTSNYVDLVGQFGATPKLPANRQSGDGKLITVPVIVKNIGNVALAAGQKVNIEIDAFDGAITTPIKTLIGQSVSSLGAKKSVTFTTTVTLPPGLAAATYNLVAKVDSSNLVTESLENNNSVTSADSMAVTYGFVDLTGTFGTAWTLPAAVVDNVKLTGTASVMVKNLGDVALPTGQTVNIQLLARDTTNGANPDIPLATLNPQSVSALAAGGSKQFSVPVSLIGGLPSDNYEIFANITPVQALTESDATNNKASQTGAGQIETILSAPEFVDLTGQFGATPLPPAGYTSGSGKLITVPVTVKNHGNIPLGLGQKINIEIDAFDGTTTTLLKTVTAQSVSSLGSGKSAAFTTTVALPLGLATGPYNLVAKIDSSGLVTESDETNNKATSSGTIAVTQGLVDLSAGKFGSSTLPASVAAGALLKGAVSVTTKNTGAVALPAGRSETIQLVAHNTLTNVDVPLGSFDGTLTAALAVNATKVFTVNVNLAAGLSAGSYQLQATITPDSNLADFTAGTYTVLFNALGKTLNITVN